MQSLLVVAEFSDRNWSAYSPNLPGVYATGYSLNELVEKFWSAARFHVEGLAEDGDPIPAVDMSRIIVQPVVYMRELGSFRRSLKLTQTALALRLGTPQSRVSDLERNPGSASFDRVRRYLEEIGKFSGMAVPPSIVAEKSEPECMLS